MSKENLEATLKLFGFKVDRFGHYKKTVESRIWRVKMQKISFRIESKTNTPNSRWYNLFQFPLYYKDYLNYLQHPRVKEILEATGNRGK